MRKEKRTARAICVLAALGGAMSGCNGGPTLRTGAGSSTAAGATAAGALPGMKSTSSAK